MVGIIHEINIRILYLKSPFVLKNVNYLIVLKNCQHLLSPYVSSNLTAIVFFNGFSSVLFLSVFNTDYVYYKIIFQVSFYWSHLILQWNFYASRSTNKISIQKQSYLLHSLLPLWGLSERESLAMVWEQSYQSPQSQKTPWWALN